MPRKGVIKFSLVEDCCNINDDKILKEISDALLAEHIIIPWWKKNR
ncbi:MAG: hypothetical protein NWF10_04545 [Candidatus Bathyarchaeota archaeon]|nr:hypothetical protein [Candidatus Bathyarchaeota archaeon]